MAQSAKVVGAAGSREELGEIIADADIVEDAGWQRSRKVLEGFEETGRPGCLKITARGRPQELRQRGKALQVLLKGGAQQQVGLERVVGSLALDEHAVHRARRYAVGKTGGDEAAGTHPDIDVDVGEV